MLDFWVNQHNSLPKKIKKGFNLKRYHNVTYILSITFSISIGCILGPSCSLIYVSKSHVSFGIINVNIVPMFS